MDNAILPLGKTLAENGLPVAEITFRSAAAEAIRLLRQDNPEMLIASGHSANRRASGNSKRSRRGFYCNSGVQPKDRTALPKFRYSNNPRGK